jgi:hypothetical protein
MIPDDRTTTERGDLAAADATMVAVMTVAARTEDREVAAATWSR